MPGTPDSHIPETIVAFDFGLRRIGVAVGQNVTGSASPVAAVGNGDAGPDWPAIVSIVREWRPTRLIVGVPTHADGSAPAIAKRVEQFIAGLERFEIPVERIDERYSTIEASELLKSQRAAGKRGRISKDDIDSASAAMIAERWLRRFA